MTEVLSAEGPDFVTLDAAGLDAAIIRGSKGWSYPWADRQVPFALIGDFDGDRRDDIALLQKSAGGGRAIAVLATWPEPAIHVLHAWTDAALGETGPTSFYLLRYPAGRHTAPDLGGGGRDSVIDLPHEGIELVYFGQAASTFFHKDGAFHRMTTAD